MTDKKVIKARKLFRRKWREAITTPDYISVLNEDGIFVPMKRDEVKRGHKPLRMPPLAQPPAKKLHEGRKRPQKRQTIAGRD